MFDTLSVKTLHKTYSVEFADDIRNKLEEESRRSSILIVDEKIFQLFPHLFEGMSCKILKIRAIEENKTYEYAGTILDYLVKNSIRRSDRMLVVGGGIIQDISSFSASVYMRGMEWVYIPTTLLAIADSCIGGKTSINLGDKKNIIGTFHPPEKVIINMEFLNTLSRDEIQSGIGEMLHYYFYANSSFLAKIESEYEKLLTSHNKLLPYIYESLKIKKSVIEIDEFDKGERRKFNYGHTFGHALESVLNYKIQHGQAVSIGMKIANLLSVDYGYLNVNECDRMNRIIEKNLPAVNTFEFSMDEYIDFLKNDKKNTGDELTCILAKESGNLSVEKLKFDDQFTDHLYLAFKNIGFNKIVCRDYE